MTDPKDTSRHTIVFPHFREDIEAQLAETFVLNLLRGAGRGEDREREVHVGAVLSRVREALDALAERGEVELGHRLLIPPHHNFPRACAAVVTKVDKVNLLDVTDEDLAKIGIVWQDADDAAGRSPRMAARAAYWSRWDAANPEALAVTNPNVWRVEFRYGWPEEGPRAA